MAPMTSPRVLALVLAGGAGSRLELLTEHRAKPAVPVGGSHRLIDVPLSNCAHSRIDDVWVVQQHHPASLADALRNGRPWDLDRTRGGLLVLPPAQGHSRKGWHEGTADALWKTGPLIREFAPDALVVLSADAVYRLDYAEVVARHLDVGAVATIVTTEVDSEPERYGVVQAGDGRITDYVYKPDQTSGRLVSNEVFVFRPGPVLDLLDAQAAENDEGLADLGTALLPQLVADGDVADHRFTGYWRDIGTVQAYWEAHLDLLPDPGRFDFDEVGWPILSSFSEPDSTRIRRGAQLDNVLVSGGADIAGMVSSSVVGPGAVIEAGAVVDQSVVLPGTRIESGAVVRRTVVDTGAVIGADSQIGAADGRPALVGHGARVPPGTVLDGGGRLPEPEER